MMGDALPQSSNILGVTGMTRIPHTYRTKTAPLPPPSQTSANGHLTLADIKLQSQQFLY